MYIISCSLCNQLYTGETYRTLQERCREHIDSINLKKNTPVSLHFNSPPHNLSHFSIAAVWRNSRGDSVHRKSMESFIIHLLGTTTPRGMNMKD